MLLNRRRKLPQTQEAFDAEVDRFLAEEGFPVTQEFRKLFAAFIQNSSPSEDTYSPKAIAKAIRKQRSNEFAFYVMFPDKRKKEDTSEAERAESPTTEVV